jgi:hypothetical protein
MDYPKIKGYLLACYRGEAGDDATTEDIRRNVEVAMEVGMKIRSWFPDSLDLFIPHENQLIVSKLWNKGLVDSEDILAVCCEIIQDTNVGIILSPMSEGMVIEWDHAKKFPPKWWVDIEKENDDIAQRAISMAIWKARELLYPELNEVNNV